MASARGSARPAFVVLLMSLNLATAALGQGFTINSPIALVADDQQVASSLHNSLGRRFTNIVIRDSLLEARNEAGRDGGPKVAIVITTARDRGTVTAYGSSLEVCHVMVTAQVLRLPGAGLAFSKSGKGKGPDCAVALEEADGKLSDELVRALEEFRRHGIDREKEHLWVQLADTWPDAELAELRAALLEVPGIRKIEPDADKYLIKFEIYRDPRALAREINGLPSVRVSRLAGSRITLSAVGVSGVTAAVTTPTPTRTAPPPGPPATRPAAPPRPATQTAQRTAEPPELQISRLPRTGGRRWALVVGISKYRDGSIPELAYPGKDALAFADVLRHPAVGRFAPDDVVVLLDNQATTRRIKMELDYLARMTQPEDLFLFFFSSHAVPGSMDVAGDAYLVTHDTEKNSLYATGFPMRELVDALSARIRAETVVGFLDACHTGQIVNRSGGAFKGSKTLTYEAAGDEAGSGESTGVAEPTLSWSEEWQTMSQKSLPPPAPPAGQVPVPGGKRVVFISSSDGEQVSWESDALGHGVFTYYVMEALRQTEGQATISSLFDFVKEEVKRTVLSERKALQEPRMFSNTSTDFPISNQP